ncbi:hypothetical protein Dimus_036661 [Dionaea muscipula]
MLTVAKLTLSLSLSFYSNSLSDSQISDIGEIKFDLHELTSPQSHVSNSKRKFLCNLLFLLLHSQFPRKQMHFSFQEIFPQGVMCAPVLYTNLSDKYILRSNEHC